MFNVGDKVRVIKMTHGGDIRWIDQEGQVIQNGVYNGWYGEDPGYMLRIQFPECTGIGEVFFIEEELELISNEPFDFQGVRMYILEAQAKLAESLFLCECGVQNINTEFEQKFVDELKEELVCAGYCMNDVMDLFDE
jgi:hypothetical protein